MKPNFKTLGKIYGKRMKDIAAAFAALSQEQIAEVERAAGDYVLALPGGDVVLRKGDYEISSEDMPGWLVASEGTLTLALDIVQTPELKREGTARELIHPIQNLRKESGFEVTDRINTTIYADGENYGEIEASLGEYADYVAGQTPVPLAGAQADVRGSCRRRRGRVGRILSQDKSFQKLITLKLYCIMAEETNKNTAPVEKTRYSDAELAEFKAIIEDKLAKAKAEYNTLREVIIHNGTNDIEDLSFVQDRGGRRSQPAFEGGGEPDGPASVQVHPES